MLTLVLLNDAELAEFGRQHVIEYAEQHVRAGEWTAAEAFALAREEMADLLGPHPRAGGQQFFKAVDAAGRKVAWVWVSPAPAKWVDDAATARWLSQITVEPSERGRGVGRAVLDALHARLAAEGVTSLWLRVYDWNEPARRLYTRCGYERVRQFPTDAHLRRRLP